MESSDIIDFSPGENYIVLRCRNKCYYVPQVFEHSPTYDKVVPLLISDINRSKSVRSLYGIFDNNYRNILLVNNYPVKRLRIFGKIIGEIYKDFDPSGRKNPKNFILITVDDFSSAENSTIKVKVFETMYFQSGLQFNESYGRIVEVSGTISEFNNIKEVHADFIVLIGGQDDIHVEISMWQELLQYRNEVLSKPWVYDSSSTKLKNAESEIDFNMFIGGNMDRETHKYFKDKIPLYNDNPNDRTASENNLLVHKNISNMHQSNDRISSLLDIDNSSDSSIQITAVKQVPIQLMTNFQLSLEFICWILRNKFKCFKLVDLYNDPSINGLLNSMTNLSYSPSQLQENKSRKILKQEIFHSTRHNLQVNYNLIKVTKSQNVYSTNLKKIYDHIKQCLNLIKFEKNSNNNIKILHIKSYLNSLSSNNPECSNLDHKILNGIIDFILTNEWNERANWNYDAKSVQWVYTKNA